MSDTTPAVETFYRGLLLGLSPEQKLAMSCRMFAVARTLVLCGLPDTERTPESKREYLFLRFYGDEFEESEKERIIKQLRGG